ncbi:hypothetical protein TKK_0012234 [Trichogramma kaykai]|uniref:Uncharacterized protein n=1 Tax=Trichogramma kaykai TaxID=54128 RepID=A0ABD2WMJ3_9HYME
MMANAAVPPGPTEEIATRLIAAITSACDVSVDDAVAVRCTGRQVRSPTSGTHACVRKGSPREHVVGKMKAPPRRTMPPQEVSCALPSRPVSAFAGANYDTRSMRMYRANHTRQSCLRGPRANTPSSPTLVGPVSFLRAGKGRGLSCCQS